jgi:hypothetical protein
MVGEQLTAPTPVPEAIVEAPAFRFARELSDGRIVGADSPEDVRRKCPAMDEMFKKSPEMFAMMLSMADTGHTLAQQEAQLKAQESATPVAETAVRGSWDSLFGAKVGKPAAVKRTPNHNSSPDKVTTLQEGVVTEVSVDTSTTMEVIEAVTTRELRESAEVPEPWMETTTVAVKPETAERDSENERAEAAVARDLIPLTGKPDKVVDMASASIVPEPVQETLVVNTPFEDHRRYVEPQMESRPRSEISPTRVEPEPSRSMALPPAETAPRLPDTEVESLSRAARLVEVRLHADELSLTQTFDHLRTLLEMPAYDEDSVVPNIADEVLVGEHKPNFTMGHDFEADEPEELDVVDMAELDRVLREILSQADGDETMMEAPVVPVTSELEGHIIRASAEDHTERALRNLLVTEPMPLGTDYRVSLLAEEVALELEGRLESLVLELEVLLEVSMPIDAEITPDPEQVAVSEMPAEGDVQFDAQMVVAEMRAEVPVAAGMTSGLIPETADLVDLKEGMSLELLEPQSELGLNERGVIATFEENSEGTSHIELLEEMVELPSAVKEKAVEILVVAGYDYEDSEVILEDFVAEHGVPALLGELRMLCGLSEVSELPSLPGLELTVLPESSSHLLSALYGVGRLLDDEGMPEAAQHGAVAGGTNDEADGQTTFLWRLGQALCYLVTTPRTVAREMQSQ